MKRNMEPTTMKTVTVPAAEVESWIDAIYVVCIQSIQRSDNATAQSLAALAIVLEANRQLTKAALSD